ncbi:hypothetical protein FBY58_0817 [Zymomonas mobilis]|uniref:Uncharacterized protein n=1 Tax=Zymomonas mobilis TaxID=542 RepID=A0A542W101_ZYMMB|nr:hypothetical protein FBY58_0817 [Zymomonas mobilis]
MILKKGCIFSKPCEIFYISYEEEYFLGMLRSSWMKAIFS